LLAEQHRGAQAQAHKDCHYQQQGHEQQETQQGSSAVGHGLKM